MASNFWGIFGEKFWPKIRWTGISGNPTMTNLKSLFKNFFFRIFSSMIASQMALNIMAMHPCMLG